jgi:hypothetical protein
MLTVDARRRTAVMGVARHFAGCVATSCGRRCTPTPLAETVAFFAKVVVMPWKIPFTPYVVTGHRGYAITDHDAHPLVKALAGQKKDHYGLARRPTRDNLLLPLPKARGALPALSLKQVTDYTRYASDKAVEKAAERTAVSVTAADELVGRVSRYIELRLRQLNAVTNQTPAPLILIGETPGSNTSIIATLATIASVKDRDATVLMDWTVSDMHAGIGLQGFETVCRSDRAMARSMTTLALQDPARREAMAAKLIAYAARQAGARVGSLNEGKHEAMHLAAHEDALEGTVRHHLQQAKGPVVVITESRHLPVLHDRIDFGIVAITTLSDDNVRPVTAHHRKRSSYLLANDDILKIRCSELLDQMRPDMLAIADQLTAPVLLYGVAGSSTRP